MGAQGRAFPLLSSLDPRAGLVGPYPTGAMALYVPEGFPDKHSQNVWIANKQGDNISRCWGSALTDMGHDFTLTETTKSNENPVAAWGKIVVEAPSKGAKSTETKKKQKG